MRINDILNLTPKDINSMSAKELRKIVSTMRRTSSQRLKRLEKVGLKRKNQVKRTTNLKKLNVNQLRAEWKHEYNFLSSKTSTVRGSKEELKNLANKLSLNFEESAKEISEQIKNIFNLYDEVKENFPQELLSYVGSERILSYINELTETGETFENIIEKAKMKVDELYNERIQTPVDTMGDFWL